MSLSKNLSLLTTVPENTINKFFNNINLIHSNDVLNEILKDKDIFELDIIEGKIIIKLEGEKLKYKFIPSDAFNSLIIDTVLNKRCKLVAEISDRLKTSLTSWRKELL